MKIYNSLYNTYPQILHAPGCYKKSSFFKMATKKFFDEKIISKNNKNITIVTWNSNLQHKSLLEDCLDFIGLPYLLLGKDVKNRNWVNCMKLTTLLENFSSIDSELILGMDSYDVLFLGNLIDIEENFYRNNCEILYASELFNAPSVFQRYGSNFEYEISEGYIYRHLNAETWIGKKSFIYDFFHDALASRKKDHSQWKSSDQLAIKNIFPKYHPEVKLDYESTIFQNIHLNSSVDFLELI